MVDDRETHNALSITLRPDRSTQTDPISRYSHSPVPSQTADKNVPYPQNQDPHLNRGLSADLLQRQPAVSRLASRFSFFFPPESEYIFVLFQISGLKAGGRSATSS